jgi:hypothetical protein
MCSHDRHNPARWGAAAVAGMDRFDYLMFLSAIGLVVLGLLLIQWFERRVRGCPSASQTL